MVILEPIDFTWPIIATKGYQVRQANVLPSEISKGIKPVEGNHLVLTDGLPLEESLVNQDLRLQRPLDLYPTLFLDFGDMDRTPEGIALFANTYGCLTEGDQVSLADSESPGGETVLARGELVEWWSQEGLLMHYAAMLWQLLARDDVQKDDVDELADCVHQLEAVYGYRHGNEHIEGSAEDRRKSRLEGWNKYAEIGYRYIEEGIREHVIGHVTLATTQRFDLLPALVTLCYRPHDLLSAMWIQFSKAASENKRFQKCLHCGTWVEIVPHVRRKSTRYCSEACRAKAYRRRQKEARQLFEEGLSLEEIASRIGTNEETAQGWVAKE